MRRKNSLLLLCVFVSLSLFGCGGGSDGGGTVISRFAGTWTGTWNDAGNNQNGTLNTTVANNGGMTGTLVNQTLAIQGSFNGTVTEAGQVNATVTYPASAATQNNGTITLNGNQMTGTLQTFLNNTLIGAANITLTRQ